MKNEVYGCIQNLDISMETNSNHSDMAFLEANYKVHDERVYKSAKIVLQDSRGDIHNIKIHSINGVSWERFFSKDE